MIKRILKINNKWMKGSYEPILVKNQKNPETEYQTRINLSGIIGKLKGKK